jgi:DNA-binding LacI/PurR family transcriptional regulator
MSEAPKASKGKGGATLAALARETGLSTETVSHILNGKAKRYRHSQEAERKVREAAERLGYRANAGARALRRGRFNAVSVIGGSDWRKNHMPAVRLIGLQEAADRYGVSLIFGRIPDEKLEDPSYVPELLSSCSSDGLLINYNSGYPERFDELLLRFRIPSVWLNSKHRCDCIYPDDFSGAKLAAEHLLRLGHSRVASWCRPRGKEDGLRPIHYSTLDRPAGYAAAMREASLEPWELFAGRSIAYPEYLSLALELLQSPERPTAIVTYSMHQATAILAAAARLGLRIPRDLSLISFHDSKASHQLSSIYLPEMELGERSLELLLRKIENPELELEPVALPLELVQKDLSCAPPPAKILPGTP